MYVQAFSGSRYKHRKVLGTAECRQYTLLMYVQEFSGSRYNKKGMNPSNVPTSIFSASRSNVLND